MKQTGSVLKGTVVLSSAALGVKVLGAFYRIYLSRLIGSEGIGLYQMAYPVYLIFLSLSTAGIPIAISKIVAEKVGRGDQAGIRLTFKAAFWLLFGLGLTGTAGMIFSANWVSTYLLADFRAVYSIWALAPSILMMSLTAVFRGYFQGWLDMQPSAWSQVFEQIVRVAVALILAGLLLKQGVERAAAGAAFGATAGGAVALCYLGVIYWSARRNQSPDSAPASAAAGSLVFQTIRQIIRFALPISIAVILTPLLQALDSIVVPRRLQAIGYSMGQATSMLGILGNSWAVVHLPLIVTTAISANLVPAIAASQGHRPAGLLESKISNGIKMALIYLVPVFITMSLFGEAIYRIIYSSKGITLLAWFAPAVLFLGLEQVSAAVIQGLGRPKWPLYSFIVGSILKLVVTVVMTGWPGLNLAGAALGTVCGAGLTTMINLTVIYRLTAIQGTFGLPVLVAGAGMYWLGGLFRRLLHLHYLVEFLVISAISWLGYLLILGCLGGIGRQELEIMGKFLKKKEQING